MSTPRTDRPDGTPEPARGGPAAGPADVPRSVRDDRAGGDVDRAVDEGAGRAGAAAPPRPRTEPAVAVTAAVTALLANLLDDSGDVWVVLDIGGLLAAGVAVAMLVRGYGLARGRPSLTEMATAAVTAAISGAVWLLAGHGPQARVGTLLLGTAAVMGALLTALVLGGALVRYRRESTGALPTAPPGASRPVAPGEVVPTAAGRTAAITTVLAAAVVVASVARDVVLR